MSKSILPVICLLLVGCQSNGQYPPSSPYSRIPVNSILTLNAPITIPVEDVAVKIQDGETKVNKPIYFFGVWCEIELWEKNLQAHTIQPGDFRITRVRESTSTTMARSQPVRVASLKNTPLMPTSAGGGDGSDPTFIRVIAEIFLESKTQPDVSKMTCSYDTGDLWDAVPISIDQIRQALGDLFTLRLAEQTNPSQ